LPNIETISIKSTYRFIFNVYFIRFVLQKPIFFLRNIQNPLVKLSVGKDLALLQAEASACGFGLANVPNVRWHLLHGLSKHETQLPYKPKVREMANYLVP
jgi:hypothetical protein